MRSAKSVKARKGLVLIEHAEAVVSKHEKTIEHFKSSLENRGNSIKGGLNEIDSKISTLEKEHRSLDAVNQEVSELNDLLNRYLTEEEINRLIKELNDEFRSCSTLESEDEAAEAFFMQEIDGINNVLQVQIVKIEEKYEERKDDLRPPLANSLKELLPTYKAIELRTAEDSSYNDRRDLYAYITSNNVWTFLLASAAALTTAAAVPAAAGAGK